MNFELSNEQQMIVDMTRTFVERELYPHEAEVEETGVLRPELQAQIQAKAIEAGLYAANIPEEFGGVGLDTSTWLLYEKELGKANYALHWSCVSRPSNILCAGTKEQREKYLEPCLRGEKSDCLAMTEPGAGSDLRGMKSSAVQDGDDWIINGTKHFISHAKEADFTILFVATGEEQTPRGPKKLITAFFVDHDNPGLTIADGYKNVSHRGYTNATQYYENCRVPASAMLGELHKGFEVANSWLGATRLQVAATCLGRAERAFDLAVEYAAERQQFGQSIGKFQGVSFKLADMATEMKAANLLVMEAGWKYDQGTCTDADMAMAKLKATEMLAMVSDEAIQIFGGMGLMSELPLERIWRDARIERIWEGTSEIQRHIISRSLLRPLGALMSDKRSLKRFLNPESIAIFGGGWAVNVITQLQKSGYQGEIWPVHPKRDEILGLKCYENVAALPDSPDASFIGVNREITFKVVKDLSEAGSGGAICFASGFREAEIDAAIDVTTQNHTPDRQDQLVEAAGDMPLLGPNCYGFINYLDNVTLWPDQHGGRPCERGVAIIAQSSNIAINMTMQKRGLNISHMLTVGNQAQTGVSELATEVLADERVSTLGLYLESFNDIRAFEKMALYAHRLGKSVVVLKIGKSLKAQIATVSHTASLAGNSASSSAFLKRLGMIEVDSIAVFLETLKLLDNIVALSFRESGSKIASVSCSGGEASLMSDLTINTRLEFPDFSEQQTKELAHILGEKVTLANPLDYHTYIWGDTATMTACFTAVMKEDLDLSVFILDIPRSDVCEIDSFNCAIEAIIEAKRITDANVAVLGTLSENLDEKTSQRFLEAGVVPLHGMQDAIAAIDNAIVAGEFKREIKKTPPHFQPVFLSQNNDHNPQLVSVDEYQAKCDLAEFGLSIPASSKVPSKDQLIERAKTHTFPLALKGLGLEHKTEVGAVILNINSEVELQHASEKLPECIDGYLLEEMAEKPILELIIGVTRDDLGLFLLTIGAGGVLTEILADTTSLLLPSSRDEIKNAIQSLKMYPILTGYRGQDGANIEAIIDAVESVSKYVEANQDTLQELDINPLLAGKTSATAVDALIRKTLS